MKREWRALLSSETSSTTLVLFNIPKDIQDELSLIEAYSGFGPVAACRLKYDRETGLSKGWAVVEFYKKIGRASCRERVSSPV